MHNLLCWTKTDFISFFIPHTARSACLTAYNLFQGVLKQVCSVINTAKGFTLNAQDCSTASIFLTQYQIYWLPRLPQAPFKATVEQITKMMVGRDFWTLSNRISFSEQAHLPTPDHGSLGFAWKAESIKPPRMETPQLLGTGKAKVLYVMV